MQFALPLKNHRFVLEYIACTGAPRTLRGPSNTYCDESAGEERRNQNHVGESPHLTGQIHSHIRRVCIDHSTAMLFHGCCLPVNRCGNLIGNMTASFNASTKLPAYESFQNICENVERTTV